MQSPATPIGKLEDVLAVIQPVLVLYLHWLPALRRVLC